MKMIRAVIFDLDDTIVDSESLHKKAWESVLKGYGHSIDEIPQKMRESQMGKRVIDNVFETVLFLGIVENPKIVYKKRLDLFLKLVNEKLIVKPGLIPLLTSLKKNKYILAVASSGSKMYVNLVLKKFNLGKYFTIVLTGNDVIHGKPNPEIFLSAIKQLRISPDECVVIEDAKVGIEAAKAAGCKCVAIETPFTPLRDLALADKIVSSLTEISPKMLKEL